MVPNDISRLVPVCHCLAASWTNMSGVLPVSVC